MSYLDKNGLMHFWSKVKAHITNKSNPHAVTKAQVGLGNVNDTSDTNKPVSVATQNALNNKVDKVSGKQLSTNDYTTAEKNKLASLGGQGTYYDHPHPAGGSYNANNLTEIGIHRFIGVPGGMTNFPDSSVMSGNFDMVVESGLGGTISQTIYFTTVRYYKRMYNTTVGWTAWDVVTYMEPDQWTKLNGIETGANKTVVDTALLSSSTNPLQNKAIYSALSYKLSTTGNAYSASKLFTSRAINGLYFDGSQSVNGFAVCTSSATYVSKSAVVIGMTALTSGAMVTIQFKYGIDCKNPTLNVNSTGARAIYYKNRPLSIGAVQPDDTVDLVYNDSKWCIVSNLYTNGIAFDFFDSLNFNDYTVSGKYMIHRNGEVFINGPGSQMSGWLDVMVNQDLITQTISDYNGRLVNTRGFYQSWSPWVTYSGAFQPLVGGPLNFVGNSIISRNLSYYQIVGDRCFCDISFQCGANIVANGELKFTNYYNPVGDYDGRFLVLDTGIQMKYSVANYTGKFVVIPTTALSTGMWIRGQISYRTDGTIHA